MSVPDYARGKSMLGARQQAHRVKILEYLRGKKREPHESISEAVNMCEFAIVEMWGDASNENLREMCNKCSNLLQAMPLPTAPHEKMKHVLKLFAYSYLGEKWEDMRRLLTENGDVWRMPDADRWDKQVIYGIYVAILYLIRKKEWSDLDKATKRIDALRADQAKHEAGFLLSVPSDDRGMAARDLAAYYHLAGTVDVLVRFMMDGGEPSCTRAKINHHFDAALRLVAGAWELEVLLILLKAAFEKMVDNSIWNVAGTINSRTTKFIRNLTGQKSKSPVYELLYPQLTAIRQNLLDPAIRATVITFPTSSGKTLLAELRILQAINQFPDNGKIVYVAPTRALVNQITSRLRQDLEPVRVRVEKMSGAIDVNFFENNVLDGGEFDVLVTTPEKLNLLIRDPHGNLAKNVVLTIIDEAHNMSSKTRGLNLEMLISNLRSDCPRSALLLMTPFIPNHQDVAAWLDPSNPHSISVQIDWWRPNDRAVGICYAKGKGRDITVHFKPLVTHNPDMSDIGEMVLGKASGGTFRMSGMRTKTNLAALAASVMPNHVILVVAQTIHLAWDVAEMLWGIVPDEGVDYKRDLVSRYVESELGKGFELAKYVRRGIGVHHAGLPDDIRELMEWLMESVSLRVMVATTTLAQGMNFPVDAILFSTYSYRGQGEMPPMDFWNIAGRAGRMDQRSMGLVGIVAQTDEEKVKSAKYVLRQTENLASRLKALVEEATKGGSTLSLSARAEDPDWSSFLQYVSHLYIQASALEEFIADAQTSLERTYGFGQLTEDKKRALLDAVKEYAMDLDRRGRGLARLSDMTGFSVQSVQKAIDRMQALGGVGGQWEKSVLPGESDALAGLMDMVFGEIPETKQDIQDIKSGDAITGEKLGTLLIEWVKGISIYEITESIFGAHDANSVSSCVKILHSKVANSASWAFSALQKIPADGPGAGEQPAPSNLPAKIYYGVDTDAAVLMRLNGVPRAVAKGLGSMYEREHPVRQATPSGAREWITKLPVSRWDSIAERGRYLSGAEYRRVWRRLAGIDT